MSRCELQAHTLRIPFRQTFRHAAAERSEGESVWVEVRSSGAERGCGEGCPRTYVTGETVASALDFIRAVTPEARSLTSLDALRAWVAAHAAEIDLHPAAWCAVELALLDFIARRYGRTVEALLDQPAIRGPFLYTAVLGVSTPVAFRAQAERYAAWGFADYKVKLAGDESDTAALAGLPPAQAPKGALRFDANNLWREPDQAIAHLRGLGRDFWAVEEPLAPAGRIEDLRRMAAITGARIVLDESLLRREQLESLATDPDRWVLNLRVSKLGGLLRTLEVAAEAREKGIEIVVGCQVGETSLLTRAALTVAQACAGRGLRAQEGAFGTHLLAWDVLNPPLMFGAGGVLNVEDRGFDVSAGFGLDFRGPGDVA